MKFSGILPVDLLKTSAFVKLTAFVLISLSLILVLNHYSSTYSSRTFFSGSASLDNSSFTVSSPGRSPVPPPRQKVFAVPSLPPVERMGVVDDNGVMSDDFKIGELDATLIQELGTLSDMRVEKEGESDVIVRIERFKVCDPSMTDYIPCLDNDEWIKRLNSSQRGEKYERHCPEEGMGLNCLVPMPKGYKSPLPWPQSRDEVWFSNVPHTRLVEDKGGQNWITIKKDKFVFPGGGTQFIHGADKYLDQISAMVPDIAFGHSTRVALDIGCGVASFGAYLMQRNVTTLSIAPKDVHENQIQFALERGVPAMVAIFSMHRLPFPSQAFDLIHCSRCRINWTRDDGILLLEADRLLRAGGYFVWAAQPVYKHEEILQGQWKEMENLTAHICWELVRKEGYIAIWRKPMDNSCYLSRDIGVQSPLCDSNDDPDEVWYTDLKSCISRLPSSACGANVSKWPARLHQPPDRLQSIKMDAHISRKELFKAESKYWKEIIDSYIGAYHWKEYNLRNVMDMRAGFGGFAAALHDLQIDCWVMNIVPVNEFNTLPVVYDRGLIGVIHDWCEPFDTYPRTYDLLHAAGLFSAEKKRKRCNISTIMLEMDRMLRPGGRVYIRDSIYVISELEEIANAMGWVNFRHDVGEGPYASWKILRSEKRF
ncbi:probable methyltransferase PMT10 isoform X1 [Prosopis cineraria]|uniref:probable methyltransferase PMT10 isoform X1 n=1 Tax=Prosopis cineraria TaxID=364024 RepID=UPI00240FCFAE|nr:probable methyltransferase PMT10 isoform X1 [Prosopis cineraria]